MGMELIKLRGERIAILAEFVATMPPDEAAYVIDKMRASSIISETAAALLHEHIEAENA